MIKLLVALCALLVFNTGSSGYADEGHNVNPTPPSSDHHRVNNSSLDTTGRAQNSSNPKPFSNETISLNNNTTKENETISSSPSHGTGRNETMTPWSQNHSSTPSISVIHTTAPPASNHSNSSDHSVQSPVSTTPSVQSTQNKTFSVSTVSTPGPNTTKTPSTTASIHTNSTSSTSLFVESPSTPVPAHTSHTNATPETLNATQPKSTETPVKNSTTKTSPSARPSQLNMEGDTSKAQDSPTLKPLLTGLVSAFIVTAVIISLLLFLKLRRRHSRPRFHRLQELPMDDMEDTPLSMYTY